MKSCAQIKRIHSCRVRIKLPLKQVNVVRRQQQCSQIIYIEFEMPSFDVLCGREEEWSQRLVWALAHRHQPQIHRMNGIRSRRIIDEMRGIVTSQLTKLIIKHAHTRARVRNRLWGLLSRELSSAPNFNRWCARVRICCQFVLIVSNFFVLSFSKLRHSKQFFFLINHRNDLQTI